MDIKEVVQPLEEMIVRYRSEETDEYTLIAHREFIWLLYLEEDDDDPVWNDIEEKYKLSKVDFSFFWVKYAKR